MTLWQGIKFDEKEEQQARVAALVRSKEKKALGGDKKDADDVVHTHMLGKLPEAKMYGMPQRVPGSANNLTFQGDSYVDYEPGTLSWLSEMWDDVFTERYEWAIKPVSLGSFLARF